ncbi:MAG: hypothetical protein ACLTAI_06520 [Thomasclavelia sp.]
MKLCGKEKIEIPLFELDQIILVDEVTERKLKKEWLMLVSIPGKLGKIWSN